VKRVLLVGYLSVVAAAGLFALLAPQSDPDAAPIRGLWSQFTSTDVGDPLRFYYFHDGGIGLYRYGKVGLNHTNSFDYEVDGDVVRLRFRKTGETYDVRFSIEGEWLVLHDDPRGPGTVRYRYVPPQPAGAEKPPVGGRLWIDQRRFATGGTGFAMYQLNPGAIDGRGVGWFHEGDFDDWSTEALSYRTNGDRLELSFALRKETATTRFVMQGSGSERALVLAEDPRGYWHRRRFVDGGPSFGALSRLAPGLDARTGRR
jgi:hypothetical protein